MITVLIPSAGKGIRFGDNLPKQYHPLKGIPILIWTLKVFEKHPLCSKVVLAVSKEVQDYVRELLSEYQIKKVEAIVEGGQIRQESVYKAMLASPKETKIFLVHDAVRPLLSSDLIIKVIKNLEGYSAVVPAIPVRDALIKVKDTFLEHSLLREGIYLVQTPQAIRADILKTTLTQAIREGLEFLDEGSLVHHFGYKVKIIEGSPLNIKITYPEDLLLAEKLLSD